MRVPRSCWAYQGRVGCVAGSHHREADGRTPGWWWCSHPPHDRYLLFRDSQRKWYMQDCHDEQIQVVCVVCVMYCACVLCVCIVRACARAYYIIIVTKYRVSTSVSESELMFVFVSR